MFIWSQKNAGLLFPPPVLRGRVREGASPTVLALSKPPPLPSPGVPGEGEKPATAFLTLNNCHLILFLLLAPFCLAASPATLPAVPPDGIDASLWERMESIDAKAEAIDDLTANFEQQKFTPLLKKPLISKGTVVARGPVMLWDTHAPEPTLMRVDEKEVTLYYPNQKTAEVYPLAGQLAALCSSPVPRLALLLQHFKFAPASAKDLGEPVDAGHLALRLTPTDDAIRQHVDNVCVLIDANHGFILLFQLIDSDGERSVIRFSDVKVNTKFDDARLRLTLPAGVKTVYPLQGLAPSRPDGPTGPK
jgi:outer membrane lipoprotein-sorting protein